MLNSQQRGFLTGLANEITPCFQIGKGGINEDMVRQIGEALDVRELIKVSVLRGAPDEKTPQEYLIALAEALKAEPVRAIGRKLILYRSAATPKKRRIDIVNMRVRSLEELRESNA